MTFATKFTITTANTAKLARRFAVRMTVVTACTMAATFALAPSTAAKAQMHAELNDFSTSLSGNYLAGRFAGSVRDADRAADFYARALLADPDNANITERAFLLEVSAGNMERAVRLADKVLKLGRNNRMANYISGINDMLSSRFTKSRTKFVKADQGQLGVLTSSLLNAWAFKGTGDLNGAIKALEPLAKTDSFVIFKIFHTALISDALGAVVKADEAYKAAYSGSSTSLRITLAYGNFLERRKMPAKAIEIYDSFLKRIPNHPLVAEAKDRATAGKQPKHFAQPAKHGAAEAMFGVASALSQDSSADLALVYTQMSLYLRQDSPSGWTLLGDIYEDMKKYSLAVASYDQVVAASRLRKNADIRISSNLDKLDRTEEAKKNLELVIAAYPKDAAPLLELGNMLRGRSNFKDAAVAYTRALDLIGAPSRRYWSTFYFRGISYEREKDWSKAEADLEKALELFPNQPLVLNYLGYSWVEKELYLDRAMNMIRKAVNLRPNDGYIVDSLGWAHYRLGNFKDAVGSLERAVQLKPDDPVINDHLGDAYWRVGRKLEATFQWQHAHDLKPTAENLVVIKQKLENGLKDPSHKKAGTETDKSKT